jgi:hypothetical protein
MDLPLNDLMDEIACYDFLVGLLHPGPLGCPRCGESEGMKVHRPDRAPILIDRRTGGRRIFNAFTGTALQGTQRRPVELVLILRGIAQRVSISQLARELGCNRPELLEFRHRLQKSAFATPDRTALPDAAVEADEMCENSGGKRRPPPRRGRSAEASCQQVPRPR